MGGNRRSFRTSRKTLRAAPIRVNGDGTPFRSYLYAADLAEWLFAILLRGVPARAYNVGSAEAVAILQLAERVACGSTIVQQFLAQSHTFVAYCYPVADYEFAYRIFVLVTETAGIKTRFRLHRLRRSLSSICARSLSVSKSGSYSPELIFSTR